jgi:hypothetical protein
MKYLRKRSDFLVENKISLPKPVNKNEINLPINEKFDMSGGQGPMGNDINWGDSLVGRLFNSIARKLVIGVNKGRMALINKQINSAFERLLDEGKIQSSNINRKEIETLKVSYFLERLTAAVHQGLKVKYLIELTEETIKLAEENDELQEKDLLLQQLNDFLDFLNEFDPEEGEDLDEDITGMSKEELAKGSDIETQGDGWETEGEALKGMVSMLKSLIGMIDNQGTAETTKDSDSELNKMKQPIIQQLNQSKIGDIKEVKTNDGVSLQLNGKSLITFLKYDHKPNATIIIHGYDWDGKSLIELKDGEKSKPINIGSKEQGEISIIIKNLLNYIKPKDTDKDTKNDKKGEPSEKEYLYDGQKVTLIGRKGDKSRIRLEDGREIEIDNSKLKVINESFIFEKSKLSEEETDSNQALNKLKNQLKNLTSDDKGISINSEFLKNLSDFSKIKEKSNKNLLKKLFDKVKQQYEKAPDFDDLYETESPKKVSEGFDVIGDAAKIETVADKIARFAKRSMQFVGENLYGSIGDLGKHLQKFNEEFGKLLNTDLKIEESTHFNDRDLYMINKKRVSSYSNFMMLNESVTQRIITYYDKKVNYNKWKIENKEIVTQIDKQLENVKIDKLPIDPIIEIVKLINRAYKIHTVEMIPSGRKSGKVSNRTYQEYEFMGEGGGGPRPSADGGVEPGFGPFRNKSLFNQFESNLLDIIKDKRFEPLFKEDVKIEGGTKPGDGKILLKFINQILDGQTLYKKGAQSKFFQEYFGFTITDNDLGYKPTKGGGDSNTGDSSDAGGDNTKKKKGVFKPSNTPIDRDDVGKVYILENSRDNTKRYMVVITAQDGGLFFKSSANPKYINQYLKDYEIENFKPTNINGESLLAKINIDSKIEKGVDIKGVNLDNYRNTKKADIKENKYFEFDSKQVLYNSEDEKKALRLENLENLSAGQDDAPFVELKEYFR